MTIATRLDQAMKDARIKSQSALSRASKVPQATISRILKGGGKNGPETETIRKLAAALGVSFEWLNEGGKHVKVASSAAANCPFSAAWPGYERLSGGQRKTLSALVKTFIDAEAPPQKKASNGSS